tara:strand:+ start:252 stop:662 length:411 start_codon:yes stop_codon:yes gene_type:complete
MLTAKQENFVELLTKGTSQTSAYRSAYDTQNMSDKTVWEEASRLKRHPKVSTRILELENEKEARRRLQAVSREERVLNELERIAFGNGPIAGKLKAMELLGKHIGFFTPKKVPEVERTGEELLTEIYRRLEALKLI